MLPGKDNTLSAAKSMAAGNPVNLSRIYLKWRNRPSLAAWMPSMLRRSGCPVPPVATTIGHVNAQRNAPHRGRPFWQKLGLLLVAVLGLVGLCNGAAGRLTARDLAETLFWSAVVLGLLAAIPIAGDPGGAVLARRAILEGQKLEAMVKANRQARYENRPWIALFASAAAIVLTLSLILSALAASF